MTNEQVRTSVDECPDCQAGECAVELKRTDKGLQLTHWPLDPFDD